MATASENLNVTTDFSLRLCALLRQSGVTVGTQQTIACMQAVLLLESFNEEELKGIYRATLINRKQDLYQLDRAYDLLMKDYLTPRSESEESAEPHNRQTVIAKTREYAGAMARSEDEDEQVRTEGYSAREVNHQKDFRLVNRHSMLDYVAELERIARRYATIARRKTKRAKRGGRVDLRTSIRESVKFDGEIIKLRFKHKVPTHSRFVVVCDVSGSMEIYGVFLLNFLYHLHRLRKIRVESFVFSTYLQSLTKEFRSKQFPEMLRNVSMHFSGWSGGTKIGVAIEALNEVFATSVTSRTTVIIMSDGWDTGDIALLDQEMLRLRRRAKSVIWINPLKGDLDYEPLAMGMAAARPYCDHFIAGHNIASFAEFARLIEPRG
ncbi:MAG: VWA domain-containing protein [Betaproteobacteria bacterium]